MPIVVSTAKSKWHLPRAFRAAQSNVCGEVSLNFGYLLFDFARQTAETLQTVFPSSHPYLLGMRSLQQLNREVIGEFLVGSLALPAEERIKQRGLRTKSELASERY